MNTATPQAPEGIRAPEGTRAPEGIRAFDQYGREVIVPRQQWATEVLPGMLAEARQNPDQLYGLILNSLNDGFVQEVAEAAQHLYATDPIPARGACMWGIVLMQSGRLDEAEQLFTGFVASHGEEASVLLNLAKVYASRNTPEAQQKADATLWRALELEPNLDNGLGWYASLAADRAAARAPTQEAARQAGQQAGTDALLRVATLPGSWRAQLWLARGTLGAGGSNPEALEPARRLYREALSRALRPVPPDFLMQMSGDLGGAGHLAELIEFTAPNFLPEFHGLPVGNNLIKAYVDTGNLEAATAVKDSLYALNRPDWKEGLGFWDTEIARRRTGEANTAFQAQSGTQPQQIQIGLLRVDGPIWLPPQSPARGIFGPKSAEGPSVTFLGGTAEPPEAPSKPELQMADAIGRMTRSLPLFFAEQTDLRTSAQGRALIPWAVASVPGQPSGFVVSGSRWPDNVAVQMVAEPANRTDYVVSVHLDAEVEPWTAELAFLRTTDGTRIGELQAEFSPADPIDTHQALSQLAQEVVDLLAAFGPVSSPSAYQVPAGPSFPAYLLRTEQLLAVRCTTVQGATPMTLSGEHEILSGQLDLCLANPENLPARLLLIETLGVLAQTRPEVAEQFRENFQRLILQHPIPALDQVFAQPTA